MGGTKHKISMQRGPWEKEQNKKTPQSREALGRNKANISTQRGPCEEKTVSPERLLRGKKKKKKQCREALGRPTQKNNHRPERPLR